MRALSLGALAAFALFVGTAQAGQVYIDATTGPGITVTDNCSGACFGNLSSIDNSHVTFDWYVGLPSISTQTVFAAVQDGTTITEIAIFNTVMGSSTVGVSFFSDGLYDVDTMGTDLYNLYGAPGFLGVTYRDGTMQKVADYLDFTSGVPPYPSIDQAFVASSPEPGTWALLGSGVLGIALARRRRNS